MPQDILGTNNGQQYFVGQTPLPAGGSMAPSLGSLSTPSYSPPNVNTPIVTSQLNNGAINLPQAVPLADPKGMGLVAGATAVTMPPAQVSSTPGLDSATNGNYGQDQGYQQAQSAYNQSVQDYTNTANAQPNSYDLLNNQRNAAGVPQAQSQLNNLRMELANTQAKYANASQQTETSGINSGTPGVIYQGQQAAIARQGAVEVSSVAARLQAAQGNYDAAEKLATDSANMQFQDAQKKLDYKKSFIDINQNNLTQAEKLAVSKMNATLITQQKELDQQKEARTFAIANNVTAPFYTLDGKTVINSSNGKAFSTPEEAQAAGVNTTTWNNVQHLDASQKAVKFETRNLGTTKNPNYVHIGYTAAGNIVSKESLGSTGGSQTTTSTKTATKSTGNKKVTAASQKDSVIDEAGAYINNAGNVGKDGYVDPQAYQYALSKLPSSAVSGFKAKYKSRLSPDERKRLGL